MKEKDRYKNQPLYVALTSYLKEQDLQWVTVTRARSGYGKQGELQLRKFSVLNPLTRNASILLECLDETAKIERVLPEVYQMAQGRLCVLEEGNMWN